MKNIKIFSMLAVIFLLSVTACTTQLQDTSNKDNSGPTEETSVSSQELPLAPDSDITLDLEIVGTTWLWERYDDMAALNNIVVADPTMYTLLLNADGTYQLKADCNLAGGSYTLEGSSITLASGPTTLAECGPDSLYNTFLVKLDNVATYVIDGDNLVLNLWADAGNMVFAPSTKISSSKKVDWDTAVEILNTGQVTQVTQLHNLQVTLTLEDGTQIETVEPFIDEIFNEVQLCGNPCSQIVLATE